jgi:hypothetical protein
MKSDFLGFSSQFEPFKAKMEFEGLVRQSDEIAALATPVVATDKTQQAYEARLRVYREAMTALHELNGSPPAEPVTEESVKTYLNYRAKYEHCSMNTLKADLAALRHYISEQGIPDPTRNWKFKTFMDGLALL